MDEENKEEDKTEEQETPTPDTNVRLSPKEEKAKRIKEVRESNAELKQLLDEEKELQAQKRLGGESLGYTNPPEKKKETDDEYAERFQKGEVDPLADDGILK